MTSIRPSHIESFVLDRARVSVVTPVGEWAPYVMRAVESALKQGGVLGEIIMVDNALIPLAMTDLKWNFEDERLRVVSSDKLQNAAHARNIGIEAASFEFIAVLDSDDEYCEGHLDRACKTLQQSGAEFFFSAYLNQTVTGTKKITPVREVTQEGLIENCTIGHSSVVYRAELKVSYPEIGRRHDYAAWLQLVNRGVVFTSSHEIGMIRHKREGSLSSGSRVRLLAKQFWVTLRYSNRPLLVAVYYQIKFIFKKLRDR